MSDKKIAKTRRARRSRVKMRELGAERLSVNRTPVSYTHLTLPTKA